MKIYELTYIVSPEITSEEAEATAKEIESAIVGREGTILKQSNPIAKTLSYPIKKRASGFLGFLEFNIAPEKLLEIKKILEKNGKIVRHMVIIKEATEMKKERRNRIKVSSSLEIEKKIEIENEETKEPAFGPKEYPASVGKEKEKVELKDIEEKLEEILGE